MQDDTNNEPGPTDDDQSSLDDPSRTLRPDGGDEDPLPEDYEEVDETSSDVSDDAADADAADADEEEEEPNLEYERAGRSDIRKAYDKFKAARAGDDDAREDIDDASRRWKVLTYLRPDVKSALVETTLPLSLIIYSVFLAVVLLILQEESIASIYLTNENRIGDLFLFDVVLIGFFVVMFLVGPKISEALNLNLSPRVRAIARGVVIVIQLVPVALLTIFVAASLMGGDVAQRAYILFYQIIADLKPRMPDFIVELGSTYYDLSPIGFSAADLLIVMFAIGVVLAVPYLLKLIKALIYVMASDPEEFPDVHLEAEALYEEPDPMDAVQWVSEEKKEKVELDIDFESVEDLLEIPEDMRMNPYPNYEEVQRYWVRAPYSYVSILKDEEQSDYRYFLMEPQLKQGEETLLLEEFNDRLGTSLLFKDIDDDFEHEQELEKKVEVIEDEVLRLANEYNISVEEETFHKLLYYIERDYVFYGKIDPLMRDPNVEDISCDGDNVPLFVFHRHYNDLLSNIAFEKRELRQFIIELAQRSGEHISAAKPLLDASLPDGSRIQMSLGEEITTRGSTFTIRLFQDTPFTPVDLISTNTFSMEQMAYLWQAIQYDKSLIFAGGTASGKTTSMNAVSLFIPPKAKVITIEDTREISLPHMNWIPGVTREGFGGSGEEGGGAGEIDMYELLRAALRQRPEYMIVGEIRGSEAQSLFQAMSTGHTTYSTMHADSVKRAVNRLTNPPINVPRDMISSLDILCIQNQVRVQDDETGDIKNVRRNESTEEIVEVAETVRTNQPFYRDAEMDEFRSNLNESHVLEEIREEQGWTHSELQEDLKARQDVLQYLLDHGINEVEEVTRTIQAYMLNPKRVTEAARDGSLDPHEYRDITEVRFREPDDRLEEGDMFDEVAAARDLPEPEDDDDDEKRW